MICGVKKKVNKLIESMPLLPSFKLAIDISRVVEAPIEEIVVFK